MHPTGQFRPGRRVVGIPRQGRNGPRQERSAGEHARIQKTLRAPALHLRHFRGGNDLEFLRRPGLHRRRAGPTVEDAAGRDTAQSEKANHTKDQPKPECPRSGRKRGPAGAEHPADAPIKPPRRQKTDPVQRKADADHGRRKQRRDPAPDLRSRRHRGQNPGEPEIQTAPRPLIAKHAPERAADHRHQAGGQPHGREAKKTGSVRCQSQAHAQGPASRDHPVRRETDGVRHQSGPARSQAQSDGGKYGQPAPPPEPPLRHQNQPQRQPRQREGGEPRQHQQPAETRENRARSRQRGISELDTLRGGLDRRRHEDEIKCFFRRSDRPRRTAGRRPKRKRAERPAGRNRSRPHRCKRIDWKSDGNYSRQKWANKSSKALILPPAKTSD